MTPERLAQIRKADSAILERDLTGDQSLPWKRVLIDRRELLAFIDELLLEPKENRNDTG